MLNRITLRLDRKVVVFLTNVKTIDRPLVSAKLDHIRPVLRLSQLAIPHNTPGQLIPNQAIGRAIVSLTAVVCKPKH